MELLNIGGPFDKANVSNGVLCLQVQEWFVGTVDNDLSSEQVMMPMFQRLYKGIKIMIIGRVIGFFLIKNLGVERYRKIILEKASTNGIIRSITLNLE